MTGSPRVAIIGAGIAGICLAQSLKKHGVAAVVYEQCRESRFLAKGFWIEINREGLTALQECLPAQLFEKLLKTSRATNHADFRWLTRAALQQCLMDGLDDAITFGKAFARYQSRDNDINIHFSDGACVHANVLVGADGVHSAVRRQYLPGAKRIDTGIFAVGGTTELSDEVLDLLPDAAINYPVAVPGPGNSHMFFAVWRSGCGMGNVDEQASSHRAVYTADHVMWRISALSSAYGLGARPEASTPQELKAAVQKMIEPWSPSLRRFVDLIEPSTLFPLPITTCVPIKRWVTTRTTLIGDAVHGMAPYGAFGASTAMRDASLLGRTLFQASQRQKTVVGAIEEYESQMIGYGFDAARKSLQILQQANSLQPILPEQPERFAPA
jgi:2-polyprenyl-6-methoxyphenol hydroxylase-like FAD-dependent oxidoreductase